MVSSEHRFRCLLMGDCWLTPHSLILFYSPVLIRAFDSIVSVTHLVFSLAKVEKEEKAVREEKPQRARRLHSPGAPRPDCSSLSDVFIGS